MVLPFLVLYLTQHLGFDAATAGLALAVYGLGSLVSAPVAGWLCDRVGALRVMQVALVAAGGLLLIFPLAGGVAPVFALTFSVALVGEAVRPASLTALMDSLTPAQRKPAIALNRLAINLGMSVGPAVGGFLAMVSFPTIFIVDGLSCLLAGAALSALLRWGGVPVVRTHEHAAVPSPGALRGVLVDRPMLVFLTFPVVATYVADAAPPARRGEYMGAYATAFSFAFIVGPWAGTALLDRFGAGTLWGLVFLCGVAAAAILSRAAQAEAAPVSDVPVTVPAA